MNWYLAVLKKYAVFNGRARRKEYWYFALFNIIAGTVLFFIDRLTTENGFIGLLYGLICFIPALAVSVRRLHDTERSVWWYLIVLVPFIGAIVLFVFMLQRGTNGPNKYGADPKAEGDTGIA